MVAPVLPAGLAAVPDALAAGPAGTLLALVRTSGASILASAGFSSRWRSVTGVRALAATPAGRSCGLVDLTAVADHSGGPVVGGGCSDPGVVGVFTRQGASWRRSGPRLPGAASALPATVLRLESGPQGTSGLVAAGRGRATSVFAIWRGTPTAPWVLSPGLRTSGRLVSTGFGEDGSLVVVTAGAKTAGLAHRISGPGAPWSTLPILPARTATVAVGPTGATALAVDGAKLTIFNLDPSGTSWLRGGTVSVPLQYGSST